MLTQIISNCGCCGLPCCTTGPGRIGFASRNCYYSVNLDFTYESLGLPTKTDRFNNCIKEEEIVYKWKLSIYNNGIGPPSYTGNIDEEGNLIGLPATVNLYCRYGAYVSIDVFCESTTTSTTTTTTTQEP